MGTGTIYSKWHPTQNCLFSTPQYTHPRSRLTCPEGLSFDYPGALRKQFTAGALRHVFTTCIPKSSALDFPDKSTKLFHLTDYWILSIHWKCMVIGDFTLVPIYVLCQRFCSALKQPTDCKRRKVTVTNMFQSWCGVLGVLPCTMRSERNTKAYLPYIC